MEAARAALGRALVLLASSVVACACSRDTSPYLGAGDVAGGDDFVAQDDTPVEYEVSDSLDGPVAEGDGGETGEDSEPDEVDAGDVATDGGDVVVPSGYPLCSGLPSTVPLVPAPPASSSSLFVSRPGTEHIWPTAFPSSIPATINGITIDAYMAGHPRGAAGLLFSDLDRDGDLDIIGFGGTVFLNQGDGTFVSGPASVLVPGVEGVAEVADLDGDDVPDLAAHGDGTAVVYHGNGDGSFRAPPTVVDVAATMLRTLDADSDSDLDLLTGRLWLNDGSGRFTDATAGIDGWEAGAMSVRCVGDVTGDGVPDLLGLERSFEIEEALWIGDGSAGFVRQPVASAGEATGRCMCRDLGDVDGDGLLDELVACDGLTWGWMSRCGEAADGSPPSRIRRNVGGDFVDAPEWLGPEAPREHMRLPFGDVDGDGDLDLRNLINTHVDAPRDDSDPPVVRFLWLTHGAVVGEPPAIMPLPVDDRSGIDWAGFRILLNGVDRTAAFWGALPGGFGENVIFRPWRPAADEVLPGENVVRVEVRDLAGNGVAAELRFFLDPSNPGLVLRVEAPAEVTAGEPAEFWARAINSGTFYELHSLPTRPEVAFAVRDPGGIAVYETSRILDPWCPRHVLMEQGACEMDALHVSWDGTGPDGTLVPPGSYVAEARGLNPPYEFLVATAPFVVR